jgi:seryl-tRNA synthetase
VKQLCEETARLATRNELLERQCENLIAELRASKDKNDAFLLELRKSQEFNDSLVADLKISRTQNDALITELRESRKKFDAIVKDFEELKDQFSMAISQHPNFTEEDLGVLRVNDKGEALLTIQVPPVKTIPKPKSKAKTNKTPVGYIRGNVKFITDKMVQQALAAFPPKKK